MGNIKEKIRNSYNKAFAGITDVNASNDLRKIQDTNKKEIPDIKMEPKEATDSGSAGVFVPPMSGEMEEKWSEKYKKSIDCNNPKGFSQKAHCQGRKKK